MIKNEGNLILVNLRDHRTKKSRTAQTRMCNAPKRIFLPKLVFIVSIQVPGAFP
jgi:hypothetical protein